MQNSLPKFLRSLSLAPAGLASALVILLLGVTAPRLAAQSDDFNDGNDTLPAPGWTHYSITGFYNPAFPGGYCPYGGTTFAFPDDGNGGKAYRITAAATIYPPTGTDAFGVGNARGGSYRADVAYPLRFSQAVDLLAWNTNWNQAAGLLWHAQNIYLGSTDGYCAVYAAAYHNLYISVLNNEVPTTVGRLVDGSVTPDPTHRYRLEASCHDGETFLFTLFDKSQPNSPWPSVIGQDVSWEGGVGGLFVFEQDYPSTTGADATFDNYVATEPASGTLPATVTDLSPTPAGKASVMYPTVTVGILNRDTQVDTTSILLCMDGVWIPNASLQPIDTQVHRPLNTNTKDFDGATVTYSNGILYAWGSVHTNSVAFMDNTSTWQTNTWTWTTAYPYLFASNSLPLGSLSVRGFDTRMVQSTNGGVNLDNSLARALQQLAIPPTIPIDQTATSIVQVLNWNEVSAPPNNVPGLCPGGSINIAVQSLAYLELTAGVHRFQINTDDRAGLYSGVNLADPNAQALWENPDDTDNTTFDFVVEAAGLYPVRCIWEQTGGGAVLQLWSTNFVTGDPEVLINDPGNPAGVVKAWYPIACRSSLSAAGTYSVDSTAVNALNTTGIVSSDCSSTVVGSMVTGGTFTVPVVAGATHFYRLDGPRATKITNISKGVSSVVITYQVQ
jgi:hypothetical protein